MVIRLINELTGRRYWYSIRYIYKKDGIRIFDWVSHCGFVKRSSVMDSRFCKKLPPPLHKMDGIPKKLLQNAELSIEIVAYLGWFKKIVK